ncbi:MAG: hypothetical protein SF187_28885 [Deltaproteobacteria bacterium]|nr:hypothetical protein [Deltaproteobacteria bacterium]
MTRVTARRASVDEAIGEVARAAVEEAVADLRREIMNFLEQRLPARRASSGGGRRFLTITKAATLISRSPKTLRRWRLEGLKGYGPRGNLIDPKELHQFLEARRIDNNDLASNEDQADRILEKSRARRERK